MPARTMARLRAPDYHQGRVREVGFRGQWLLPPTCPAATFPDGVRYGIAIDDDGWMVVCRSGTEGGVRPSVRWYVDAAGAAGDGVPERALRAALGRGRSA